MIPVRVYVKGFLSYREEAELRFDGAPLWVLAGRNGAGKSAIFDAITFALYGAHRGGKSNVEDLINHDANEMIVEFDFALENAFYRVKRTITKHKKRPSFQIFQLKDAKPQPLTGTDKKDGFEKWIKENIGLDDRTFTASVLLRQGESEALLKVLPKDRHEILAQIVDLSKYEKLHEAATERQKKFDIQEKTYHKQLEGYAPVDEDEIHLLAAQAQAAQAQFETLQKQVEQLIELKVHARRWTELDSQRTRLEDSRQAASQALLEMDSSDRERLREGGVEGFLVNLEERLVKVQEGLAQIAELNTAIPWMELFSKARRTWHSLNTDEREVEAEIVGVAERLVTLSEAKLKASERMNEMLTRFEQTQTALATANLLLKQTEEQASRFRQVDGQPNCSYCGQPLKPEHLESERTRVERQLQTAGITAKQADVDFKQARRIRQESLQEWQQISDEEQKLRDQDRSAKQRLEQIKRQQSKAEEEAQTAMNQLPPRYRHRLAAPIADCFALSFPTATDFVAFTNQINEQPSLQHQLEQFQTLATLLREQQERNRLFEEIQQQLDEIPVAARRPVAQLEANERLIRAKQQQADNTQRAAEQKQQQLEERREQRRELEGRRREAAKQMRLHKELAKFFGRDYLQRYLLKQAEIAIVANANRALDHLSGGTLRLKLADDEIGANGESFAKSAVKALDLIAYNKETGNVPEPVAFLSGSQRFRVAISLALGIGQFAGGASQRIESVIIDEGFGGLDKEGRSKMIEELQALKNVLRRIILVSHQEEFANAFPNRYTIKLENGSSRVSLFEQE